MMIHFIVNHMWLSWDLLKKLQTYYNDMLLGWPHLIFVIPRHLILIVAKISWPWGLQSDPGNLSFSSGVWCKTPTANHFTFVAFIADSRKHLLWNKGWIKLFYRGKCLMDIRQLWCTLINIKSFTNNSNSNIVLIFYKFFNIFIKFRLMTSLKTYEKKPIKIDFVKK